MKKLISLVMFLGLVVISYGQGFEVRNDTIPPSEEIADSYWNVGLTGQSKRTNVSFGLGFRERQSILNIGILTSVYRLQETSAYEYSAQLRMGSQWHLLNYGFLHSWDPTAKKQYRWSPYLNFGLASGVRYVQNHHLIIYDLERWNWLVEVDVSLGVKYAPKDIFGWHTAGYLELMAEAGLVDSNIDGRYWNFSIGFSHAFGY